MAGNFSCEKESVTNGSSESCRARKKSIKWPQAILHLIIRSTGFELKAFVSWTPNLTVNQRENEIISYLTFSMWIWPLNHLIHFQNIWPHALVNWTYYCVCLGVKHPSMDPHIHVYALPFWLLAIRSAVRICYAVRVSVCAFPLDIVHAIVLHFRAYIHSQSFHELNVPKLHFRSNE